MSKEWEVGDECYIYTEEDGIKFTIEHIYDDTVILTSLPNIVTQENRIFKTEKEMWRDKIHFEEHEIKESIIKYKRNCDEYKLCKNITIDNCRCNRCGSKDGRVIYYLDLKQTNKELCDYCKTMMKEKVESFAKEIEKKTNTGVSRVKVMFQLGNNNTDKHINEED